MKANIKIEEKMIYIIFALLVLFADNANAQYKYIPNFENFIGTWEYKTDKEHFILKTEPIKYTGNINGKSYTLYCLIGRYKYVKDGIIICDFLENTSYLPYPQPDIIKFGRSKDLPNNIPQTKLTIRYMDFRTECNTKSWCSPLTYIPGNPAQLSWHLEPDEYIVEIVEDEETEAVEETNKSEEKTTKPVSIPVNEDMVYLDERPRSDLFTIPVDMILTKIE